MSVKNMLRTFVNSCSKVDKNTYSGDWIHYLDNQNQFTNFLSTASAAGAVPPRGSVYIDTGQFGRTQGRRLWTDRASWCVIFAALSRHNGGFLVHMSPGRAPIIPSLVLKAFSPNLPDVAMIFTMESHLSSILNSEQRAGQSALYSVHFMLERAYPLHGGALGVASRTTIVTGYHGKEWDAPNFGVAVEDYGIFPISSKRAKHLWNDVWETVV